VQGTREGKHPTMPVWLKGNGFRNTSSFLKIDFAPINLQLWHCSPKSWKTIVFDVFGRFLM